jgi:cardiolipin synthase
VNSQVFTLANIITCGRLILFGIFLWLLYQGEHKAAAIVFIVAWALDAVDGLAARVLKQESHLGSVLDKTTDRILLGVGTLAFIKVEVLPDFALLLFVKDFALLPVLTIHAAQKEPVAGVGKAGKFVTLLQGLGVIYLLAGLPQQFIVVLAIAIIGGVVGAWHLYRVVYAP